MEKKKIAVITVSILAVIAVVGSLLVYRYNKKITAKAMRLLRAVGTVELEADGKVKTIVDNMRLMDGNALSTGDESLASISLDESKIITIEENSRAEFYKDGKKLELKLTAGRLFFDVRKPLNANESLDIKSSTMVVGIRGTAGYVWIDPVTGEENIFLAAGQVEVSNNEDEDSDNGDGDPGSGHTTLVKPGEILVRKVTEENGERKTVTYVKKAEISDIPPEVFHELAKNHDTFERFIEESGFNEEEVLQVIEDTKDSTYLTKYLVRINDKGEVEELSEGGTGEEEKKTLSVVIQEIAGKLFGTGEPTEGDPSLGDGEGLVSPSVTVIPGENLPTVNVTKPSDGVTPSPGTTNGATPTTTPTATPTVSAPVNPQNLQVAGLEDMMPPDPTPTPGSGLTPDSDSDPSPVPAVEPGSDSDSDPGSVSDPGSDPAGSPDDNGGAVNEPDPEPQTAPTPTPAALPCSISDEGKLVAVSGTQNVNISVLTGSTVQNMNLSRSGDDLVFAAASFNYKSELTLSSGSTVIGTYHINSGSSFTVPVSALGSYADVSVKTGTYLPATFTDSSQKTLYFDGTQAGLKVKSGSAVTSMTMDRDNDNVYIYGEGLGSGVELLMYSSGGYVGPCYYDSYSGRFVVELDDLKDYGNVSFMAMTPYGIPVDINNTQKLVYLNGSYALINTASTSFEVSLDEELESTDEFRVDSESFVPGSKLKITSGSREVNTYTLNHDWDHFAIPYEDVSGYSELTFALITPGVKNLPATIDEEGALVRLSSGKQVFFYVWAGFPDGAQVRLSESGDDLKFEYSGFGKRNGLWLWAGDSTLNEDDGKEYDQFDSCIYVSAGVIGTNDNVGIQLLSANDEPFGDDIIDTSAAKKIYYGNYSNASDCDQIKLKVKSGSSVTQMRVKHYPSENANSDLVTDGLVITDDAGRFNGVTTLYAYNSDGTLVHTYEYNGDLGGYHIPKTGANALSALGSYELYTEVTAWTVSSTTSASIPVGNGSVGLSLETNYYDISDAAGIIKNSAGDYIISVVSSRGNCCLILLDGDTEIKRIYFAAAANSTFSIKMTADEMASYIGKTITLRFECSSGPYGFTAGDPAISFCAVANDPDKTIRMSLTADSESGSSIIRYSSNGDELLLMPYSVGGGDGTSVARVMMFIDGSPVRSYGLGADSGSYGPAFHIPISDWGDNSEIAFKYYNTKYLISNMRDRYIYIANDTDNIRTVHMSNASEAAFYVMVTDDKISVSVPFIGNEMKNISMDLSETTADDTNPNHIKRTWYRTRAIDSGESYEEPYLEIPLSRIADGDTYTVSAEYSEDQAANGEDYTTNYIAEIYSSSDGLTYSDAVLDSAKGIFGIVPDGTAVPVNFRTNISIPGDFTSTSPYCVFQLLFESDDLTSGKWYVKGYDSSGTEVTYPENVAANIANGFAFDPENGDCRDLQMHYKDFIPGNGTGSFDGGEIRVTLQRTE